MTQQLIGIGTSANDGTGDPGRVAFGKVNDNFTELYSFNADTALQADGSVNSTANQHFESTISMQDFTSDTGTVLGIDTTYTTTGFGQSARAINGTSRLNSQHILSRSSGLFFYAETIGNQATAISEAIHAEAKNNSSTGVSGITGIYCEVGTAAGTSGGSSGAIGINVQTGLSGSGTITNIDGINIGELGLSGSGGATNVYGLKVNKQIYGTSINHGIWLNGNDGGADIVFGTGRDVSLHYDGTNLTLDGSGISTTPDTTSTITHTVPIDINGTVYKIMLTT